MMSGFRSSGASDLLAPLDLRESVAPPLINRRVSTVIDNS